MYEKKCKNDYEEKIMKRIFFVTLSLIFIVNNNALYGMITNKARRSFSYKTVQQPKTLNYTNLYRKPILFDRVNQYYKQIKQNISQWWYGKNYPQMTRDEATAILNDIHNKKNMANTAQFFDTFLKEKNQESVDQLLNALVFSNHEINFLNARANHLFGESAKRETDHIKIARKIINWAQENITRFFLLLDENIINEDFFLISLLYIDSGLDKKLIPIFHDELHNIQNTPSGGKFLALIKSKNPTIYNAIMQREQRVKGILKEGMQKSLEELRTKQ